MEIAAAEHQACQLWQINVKLLRVNIQLYIIFTDLRIVKRCGDRRCTARENNPFHRRFLSSINWQKTWQFLAYCYSPECGLIELHFQQPIKMWKLIQVCGSSLVVAAETWPMASRNHCWNAICILQEHISVTLQPNNTIIAMHFLNTLSMKNYLAINCTHPQFHVTYYMYIIRVTHISCNCCYTLISFHSNKCWR